MQTRYQLRHSPWNRGGSLAGQTGRSNRLTLDCYRSSESTGSGSVPALCSSSRQPRPSPLASPSIDHEQLPSGPSRHQTSSGRLSTRPTPQRTAPPWLTSTNVAPRGVAATASTNAACTRSPTSTSVSPSAGCQTLACSGKRRQISLPVMPSHDPPDRSRSRSSYVTSRPVSAASAAAVAAARCKVELTILAGSSAASRLAPRAACSRPISSSATSVEPWNRFSRFQRV